MSECSGNVPPVSKTFTVFLIATVYCTSNNLSLSLSLSLVSVNYFVRIFWNSTFLLLKTIWRELWVIGYSFWNRENRVCASQLTSSPLQHCTNRRQCSEDYEFWIEGVALLTSYRPWLPPKKATVAHVQDGTVANELLPPVLKARALCSHLLMLFEMLLHSNRNVCRSHR